MNISKTNCNTRIHTRILMGLTARNLSSSNLGIIHRIDGENNACVHLPAIAKHKQFEKS